MRAPQRNNRRRSSESPNNTVVLAGSGGQIIDAAANHWTIVGGVVKENGGDPGGESTDFSSGVTEIYYLYTTPIGHAVLQTNGSGWWYWDIAQAVGSRWVATSNPAGVTARRTEDWRLFLAANTALPNPGLPNADPALVGPALNYMGMVTIRANNTQSSGVSGAISTFNAMAVTVPGLRVELVFYYSDVNGGTITNGVTNLMSLINGIEGVHPGTIIAVEGPNEADISGDSNLVGWNATQSTRIANANTAQSQMYTAVKAAYPTKEVQLWGLGSEGNSAAQGNQSAVCDTGSVHDYVDGQYDQDIYTNVQTNYVNIVTTANAIGKPWVSGEFGFPINPLSGIPSQGTNTDVQCRMGLSQYMDHWILGAVRSCIYSLIDNNASGDDYGIFDHLGNPRPLADALKAMIAIMLDTGGTKLTFTPGGLAYSVSGQPARFQSALLEKSNGTFYLLGWASPQIWDGFAQAPVSVSPTTTTFTFTANPNFTTIHVYDPMISQSPIASGSGNSVAFGIQDHPIIAELIP